MFVALQGFRKYGLVHASQVGVVTASGFSIYKELRVWCIPWCIWRCMAAGNMA
jgi:hypothetical protein